MLNDPRTLHCFHSFCKRCLEKFIQGLREENENPELNTFNCPICRSEFTLNPVEEVDGIGANYFVRSMLDVMAVESRVKGIPCQHCEKASVSRCVDCEIFMCEGCLQGHNNYSGFKTHHLLSMDELCKPENRSKIRGQPRCKEHDDEIKRYFCETCEELICQYCRDDDDHHDHKHSLLKKAGEQKKEDLQKWCATLTEEFNGSNKTLQAMAHVAKVLDNNVEASKKKIQERKAEILAAVSRILDEKEKSLTDKIDIMYRIKSTAINKQLDEVQGYANQVKNSIDVCRSLLEGDDVVEIVSSHRLVCKNIEKGKKERPGKWKLIDDGRIRFDQCSMDGTETEMRKLSERLGEIKGKEPLDAIGFFISANLKVVAYKGDITKEETDVIVNSCGDSLDFDAGVSLAIVNAGGPSIKRELNQHAKKHGDFASGSVVVTEPGHLKCKKIFHAFGPSWKNSGKDQCVELMIHMLDGIFECCLAGNATSIAMPAISCGCCAVPTHIWAKTLILAINKFDKKLVGPFEIRIVDINEQTVKVFQQFGKLSPHTNFITGDIVYHKLQ